ncbi:MAG: tetratricopeptide repeat protein [bacterium]
MARRPIDTGRRQQIESIFEEAIELAPAERPHWLAARCGADPRLRAEVEALIGGHERVEGVLEHSVAAAASEALKGIERGRRIGAYKVLRELGRGGMGVVYLAERDDGQYEQRVAVKLLRASPDADDLQRRFVAERQILASLRHRAIAGLLDGGVTDGRLPFLVMEYVDGVPITTYCDRQNLGIDARLRLFRDVCSAVHYAHQNLIIHRDIKPGNILVSPDGGVKLLDFGIAKLLTPALDPAEQPRTRTDRRAMTPEYASPEQVRGDAVTTASDVYALGVVLYELLSGQRPYHLTSGSPHELIEVICSRVPERPSAVSDHRLRHRLKGDLDAIVMRALRKDAADRYGSVDLLWEDLQRHLDGMPVHAHRGSRVYRARKFLGRNRLESAATAVVALSLAVGIGTSVRQSTRAQHERDRAERALADVEQSLRQSESVTGFLVGLFDATTPVPGAAVITAQELIRRGTAKLETFRGQPLLQARMLETMARVYIKTAQYPEARAALEHALSLRVGELGPLHAEVAGTFLYLGELMRRTGHYHEADSLTRRALDVRNAALGPEHPANAEVLEQLASIALFLSNLNGAETLSRRALEIRRQSLRSNDPLIAESLESHAAILRRVGKIAEAEAEFHDAIAVYRAAAGPESPDAANLELPLADIALEAHGDTAQAEALMRSSLAKTRATLGTDHLRASWAMDDLARLLVERGQYREAEQLSLAGLEIQRKAFGAQHPYVATYANLLVTVYVRTGRLAEAERLERRSIATFERTFGPNHTVYAGALGDLSEILMARGRYDEAIALRQRSIDIRVGVFGRESAIQGLDQGLLARAYARSHQFVAADSVFRLALANQRRYVPETHIDIRRIFDMMSERYRLGGNHAEAERYARLAQPP